MHKIQGHVVQPMLSQFSETMGKTLQKGWSVRSRAVPDYYKLMMKANKELEGLHTRAVTKHEKIFGKANKVDTDFKDILKWEGSEARFVKLWDAWAFGKEEAVTEQEIRGFMKTMKNFVRSPVDECGTDALIM